MEFSQLLRAARQFERVFAQRISPVLERCELTMGEIRVLLFLANNPGCDTARDVVMVRGLGKSQVSQAVELLVGKGLLERSPSQRDRRIVHLTITQAGWPVAREAQAVQARCGRALFEGLTPEEMETLRVILEKIVANSARLAGEEQKQ